MPEARRSHRSPSGSVATAAKAVALVALAVVASAPSSVEAQVATVGVDENFRAEPNGTILAEVRPGTVLAVEGREGGWVEAALEGWIWSPSVESIEHPSLDLRVSSDGGENLRVEPQGTILARLMEGTLLEELERRENWVRVRRTAWIWAQSVELDEEVSPAGTDGSGTPSGAAATGSDAWATLDRAGTAVLGAPDGSDTLAVGSEGTDVQVLGRRGGWARVRLEGWVWMPAEDGETEADSTVLTDVTPADLAADPGRFRGRIVSWELQFVSRERAESIRTDFYEGEPYLLTRYAGRSSSFVYVAVPPDRLETLGELIPLERIRVVGRVRTPEAALTGGPILDLLELSRLGRSTSPDGG